LLWQCNALQRSQHLITSRFGYQETLHLKKLPQRHDLLSCSLKSK